jgi:hypothetical protein
VIDEGGKIDFFLFLRNNLQRMCLAREQEVRLRRATEPTDASKLAVGAGGHPLPLLPTRGKRKGMERKEKGEGESN